MCPAWSAGRCRRCWFSRLASYVIIRREKLVMSPILLPIFLFFAVQVAGTLFADYRYEATNNLITFILEGLGIFFLITNVVRTPRMMRQVTWALLIAGARYRRAVPVSATHAHVS